MGIEFRLNARGRGCHASADWWHRLLPQLLGHPRKARTADERNPRSGSRLERRTVGSKIETFHSALVPGVTWLREIAGYSRDTRLNHHPSRPFQRLDATVTIEEIWIRLEHQLLLKLPRSGSILFGIRVELTPLSSLLADEQAAARLLRVIFTMSPAATTYKGIAAARDRIIELIQRQPNNS